MSSGSYPQLGTSKEVAYNPERREEAKVIESVGAMWWIYLFPTIGGIMVAYALYAYAKSRRRDASVHRLMQSGQKLQSVLEDIQTDGTTNNSTYKIVVSATSPDGTVQNYISDPLTGIGGLAMADFRFNPYRSMST